jgi:hypothetical protein
MPVASVLHECTQSSIPTAKDLYWKTRNIMEIKGKQSSGIIMQRPGLGPVQVCLQKLKKFATTELPGHLVLPQGHSVGKKGQHRPEPPSIEQHPNEQKPLRLCPNQPL